MDIPDNSILSAVAKKVTVLIHFSFVKEVIDCDFNADLSDVKYLLPKLLISLSQHRQKHSSFIRINLMNFFSPEILPQGSQIFASMSAYMPSLCLGRTHIYGI